MLTVTINYVHNNKAFYQLGVRSSGHKIRPSFLQPFGTMRSVFIQVIVVLVWFSLIELSLGLV